MTDQTHKPKGTFARLMSSSPIQEEKGQPLQVPETPKSGKTENLKSGNREYLKAIKYSTQLHPDLIKRVKQYALVNDVKDYEVIQEALIEYLTRKHS